MTSKQNSLGKTKALLKSPKIVNGTSTTVCTPTGPALEATKQRIWKGDFVKLNMLLELTNELKTTHSDDGIQHLVLIQIHEIHNHQSATKKLRERVKYLQHKEFY